MLFRVNWMRIALNLYIASVLRFAIFQISRSSVIEKGNPSLGAVREYTTLLCHFTLEWHSEDYPGYRSYNECPKQFKKNSSDGDWIDWKWYIFLVSLCLLFASLDWHLSPVAEDSRLSLNPTETHTQTAKYNKRLAVGLRDYHHHHHRPVTQTSKQ